LFTTFAADNNKKNLKLIQRYLLNETVTEAKLKIQSLFRKFNQKQNEKVILNSQRSLNTFLEIFFDQIQDVLNFRFFSTFS
jgi:predicted ATPase